MTEEAGEQVAATADQAEARNSHSTQHDAAPEGWLTASQARAL